MKEINYDQIIEQLKSELNSQCAIANRYGIVLASLIDEFAEGKLVPHKILELIDNRQEIADELNINLITSFAVESQEHNYIFTFSQKLILVSKLITKGWIISFSDLSRIISANIATASSNSFALCLCMGCIIW